MNLLSAILLGAAAGLTVVLVRQLTGRTVLAAGGRAPSRAHADPVADGRLRRPAHAPPRARRGAARPARGLGGGDGARDRRGQIAGSWRPPPSTASMLGNHALTVLLAPGIALFVLAVEPGILRRPRLVALCAVALLGTAAALYLQLPIRAAMGAPLVYGRPDTLGRLLVRRPRPSSSAATWSTRSATSGARPPTSRSSPRPQLGVLAAAVPAAFAADGRCGGPGSPSSPRPGSSSRAGSPRPTRTR